MIVLKMLGFAVIFILFAFIVDVIRSNKSINKNGGVREKYSELIQHLLDCEMRMKIISSDSNSVSLGFNYTGGNNKFSLIHNFDEISIYYAFKSNIYGVQKLEWHFLSEMDQSAMAEKIFRDMEDMNKDFI